MFEVTVKGNTPQEILSQLMELAGAIHGPAEVVPVINPTSETETPGVVETEAPEPTFIEDIPADEEPVAEHPETVEGHKVAEAVQQIEEAKAEAPEPEKTYTIVDVRARMKEALSLGVVAADLVHKYAAKLTAVDKSDFPALMADIDAAIKEKGGK